MAGSRIERKMKMYKAQGILILLASFSVIANAATFHTVGEVCAKEGEIAFADASGVHQLACVGGTFVDAERLEQVKLTLDATSVSGFDTHVTHWTQFLRSGIRSGMKVSVQPADMARDMKSAESIASFAKVVLKPDQAAHVLLELIATKRTGQQWSKYVNVDLPLGKATVVAKDDDGVEYAIKVESTAS